MIVELHQQQYKGEISFDGDDNAHVREMIDQCLDECNPQDVTVQEWIQESRGHPTLGMPRGTEGTLFFKMRDPTTAADDDVQTTGNATDPVQEPQATAAATDTQEPQVCTTDRDRKRSITPGIHTNISGDIGSEIPL